jgi:hypothetical protein
MRREEPRGMIRTIRGLAVAGLIALALSAWMYHALIFETHDVSVQVAIAAQALLQTSALLSFSAGLLTLTLTIPRRQRLWSAALLVSLLLYGYWPVPYFSVWWYVLIPRLATLRAAPFVVQFFVTALVPATPALLALGYTVSAAGRVAPAPQAPQTVEEGSLDITIRPMESETC